LRILIITATFTAFIFILPSLFIIHLFDYWRKAIYKWPPSN